MFSLRSSCLILFILITPFVLRLYWHEPYPAILLPSGASSVQKSGQTLDLITTEVFVYDSSWHKITPRELITPIPLQYFGAMLGYDLGFERDTIKGSGLRKLLEKNIGLYQREALAPSDFQELGTWFKTKLLEQGISATALKIVKSKMTLSLESATIISKSIVSERFIQFPG